ncbi:heterokaryon incompatibility protein-domain-containing protein [Podospora aff. communis PSN243]|uniref:Heterokaryon incompatibility protein-domain-containing protein n=1 Tax=Podospora aff. communis PSN243 TaxID=3040156 RepID=A0AAV9GP13_9PEZI|nr:heterokaryon incompatibility protein-domain-containing protein [Podospora aff. communis PSN243]
MKVFLSAWPPSSRYSRPMGFCQTRPSRSHIAIGPHLRFILRGLPIRGTRHMASIYETVRLASPKDIRLVTNLSLGGDGVLTGNLIVASLDSKPNYGALSYTWGDPGAATEDNSVAELATPTSIFLNGTETPVGRNLCDFLLILAPKDPGDELLLWIDALCINQADVVEKSSQVAMMGDIYRCASSVIVWLGREDGYTATAIHFIERLSDAFVAHGEKQEVLLEKLRSGEVQNSETDWDALQYLFTRTWFQRAWIVQEVALARELGVVLGQQACFWTSLCVAARAAAVVRIGTAWHMVLLLRMWVQVGLDRGGLSLVQALYLGRYFQATEPVDHVFSLYGISHTKMPRQQEGQGICDAEDLVMATSALPVNYSLSAVDAFTRTARHVVEVDGDLSILLFPREAITPTLEGLPSWVPDFSKTYVQMDMVAIKEEFPWYAATGANRSAVHPSSDERVLALSAQKVATIEKMIPLRKTPSGAIDIDLIVDFLANVDDVQIAGMDQITGLARALLYEHNCAAALEDEEIKAQFEQWIQHTVVQRLAIGDGDVLAENYRRVTEKHFTGGMSRTSRQQVGDGQPGCSWDRDDGVGGMISGVGNTKLFLTSTGHIGNGEVDVRPGDRVWLVPGLHLPLVLRPVAGGRYRSLGRAYLHGVMRGEAIREARLEVIELE